MPFYYFLIIFNKDISKSLTVSGLLNLVDVLKVLWPGHVLGNLVNVFCLLIPEDVELLEPAALGLLVKMSVLRLLVRMAALGLLVKMAVLSVLVRMAVLSLLVRMAVLGLLVKMSFL